MKKTHNWLNHVFNFFAVILGVYLAFMINEQAKISQDRAESLLLMNSIVNDLSQDIKIFEEYQIPVNTQHQQNVENVLESLFKGDIEGMNAQLPSILEVENNSPRTTTYNSMKFSGKLRLINDLSVQKNLTVFYDGLVEESIKKGEIQAEYFTKELLTWMTYNVDFSTMELLNKEELVVLRNKLLIYGSLIEQKVDSYKMIVEDSKQLKLQIEAILES